MARQFRLWENLKYVLLLASAADAGGRTSNYVSMGDAHKATIACEVNQGNAAQVTFTLLQAQDSSGTGAKALSNPAPVAFNLNTANGDQFSFTTGANYQTDAGTNSKIVLFEIEPGEALDVTNGFSHIAVQTSASNVANVTSARAVMGPLRNARQNPLPTNV